MNWTMTRGGLGRSWIGLARLTHHRFDRVVQVVASFGHRGCVGGFLAPTERRVAMPDSALASCEAWKT